VAIAVDEWGAWFDSEKDAPSQLYLESTLRDAVIAGMSLNIFNNHADRVRMANVAQMVNVIQSLVLTQGAKMVVTPTWHVFDLYKVHQNATMIPTMSRARCGCRGSACRRRKMRRARCILASSISTPPPPGRCAST